MILILFCKNRHGILVLNATDHHRVNATLVWYLACVEYRYKIITTTATTTPCFCLLNIKTYVCRFRGIFMMISKVTWSKVGRKHRLKAKAYFSIMNVERKKRLFLRSSCKVLWHLAWKHFLPLLCLYLRSLSRTIFPYHPPLKFCLLIPLLAFWLSSVLASFFH